MSKRRAVLYPIWAAIDPEALGFTPADESVEWFHPLAEPVHPIPPTSEGWYSVDAEMFGEPLRDEIQWWRALDGRS